MATSTLEITPTQGGTLPDTSREKRGGLRKTKENVLQVAQADSTDKGRLILIRGKGRREREREVKINLKRIEIGREFPTGAKGRRMTKCPG